MIRINDKYSCCGCSACVQACPKKCISFDEDEQGFRYPLINKDLCIDCGLCEKVCPCINQNEPRKPIKVYAAINHNVEIRMKSSSGGIFTMLAEAVIEEGGVVFGARFDENWEVKHDYTETKEGLEAFRGSKYVQSRIGDTYKQALCFLKSGRKVLYSGTPCQIAGLKHFIKKDYDNLLALDIICHGVPSPAVWRNYINEAVDKRNLVNISFREKKGYSWRRYGMSFIYKDTVHKTLAKDNLFFKGYLQNLYLRPSCFSCPAKASKSGSDITIGDFWGIEFIDKSLNDNKGTSIILVNTKRGYDYISDQNFSIIEVPAEKALSYNTSYFKSTSKTSSSKLFYRDLNDNYSTCESIIRNLKSYTIIDRVISVIKHKIKQLI